MEAGDLDLAGALLVRAEMAAGRVSNRDWYVQALADLARIAVEAGDLDRAETLAGQAAVVARPVSNLGRQAEILVGIASDAEPGRARLLLARALTTGHWLASVGVLAKIDPGASAAVSSRPSASSTDARSLRRQTCGNAAS